MATEDSDTTSLNHLGQVQCGHPSTVVNSTPACLPAPRQPRALAPHPNPFQEIYLYQAVRTEECREPCSQGPPFGRQLENKEGQGVPVG